MYFKGEFSRQIHRRKIVKKQRCSEDAESNRQEKQDISIRNQPVLQFEGVRTVMPIGVSGKNTAIAIGQSSKMKFKETAEDSQTDSRPVIF